MKHEHFSNKNKWFLSNKFDKKTHVYLKKI